MGHPTVFVGPAATISPREFVDDSRELFGLLFGVEVFAEPVAGVGWRVGQAQELSQLLVGGLRWVVSVNAGVRDRGFLQDVFDCRISRHQREHGASDADVLEELAGDLHVALRLNQ